MNLTPKHSLLTHTSLLPLLGVTAVMVDLGPMFEQLLFILLPSLDLDQLWH